eukprot:TRINITY_DN3155_c0_g1_i1.p1 TRINITY_DN3155_c0_g1~~TRINITY_DN3155_c0_g1_i1.p1  ORF type:complete len:308 (+),score=66.08 TRINITY_DN3155_c0_g1_i1:492-1415(+)
MTTFLGMVCTIYKTIFMKLVDNTIKPPEIGEEEEWMDQMIFMFNTRITYYDTFKILEEHFMQREAAHKYSVWFTIGKESGKGGLELMLYKYQIKVMSKWKEGIMNHTKMMQLLQENPHDRKYKSICETHILYIDLLNKWWDTVHKNHTPRYENERKKWKKCYAIARGKVPVQKEVPIEVPNVKINLPALTRGESNIRLHLQGEKQYIKLGSDGPTTEFGNTRADIEIGMGKEYFEVDEYDEAIACFEEAQSRATSEKLPEIYLLLGTVYAHIENYAKAIKYLERNELKNNRKAQNNLAYCKSMLRTR